MARVAVEATHVRMAAIEAAARSRDPYVQAPLLRGILTAGVPIELAVPLSAELAADADTTLQRRRYGDLAVGVAAGTALRATALPEAIHG